MPNRRTSNLHPSVMYFDAQDKQFESNYVPVKEVNTDGTRAMQEEMILMVKL